METREIMGSSFLISILIFMPFLLTQNKVPNISSKYSLLGSSYDQSENLIDMRETNSIKSIQLQMHRGLIDIGPPKWPKEVIYIPFLDKKLLTKIEQKRSLCLGQQPNEEVAKFVYTVISALNSTTLVIWMPAIVLIQGRSILSHGIFIPCPGGERGYGQCIFFYTGSFSNNFNSK